MTFTKTTTTKNGYHTTVMKTNTKNGTAVTISISESIPKSRSCNIKKSKKTKKSKAKRTATKAKKANRSRS